jgi:hypothetical protein
VYTSLLLYTVISFKGVTLESDGASRIHFFLWLMSKNMPLTRDNQGKRRVEDKTYLLCTDSDSIHHLFFECIVAKQAWGLFKRFLILKLA